MGTNSIRAFLVCAGSSGPGDTVGGFQDPRVSSAGAAFAFATKRLAVDMPPQVSPSQRREVCVCILETKT